MLKPSLTTIRDEIEKTDIQSSCQNSGNASELLDKITLAYELAGEIRIELREEK